MAQNPKQKVEVSASVEGEEEAHLPLDIGSKAGIMDMVSVPQRIYRIVTISISML